MSIVKLEAVYKGFAKNADGSNKIIEVEFHDDDGCCDGSNAHNWCNLIELTGEPGNWAAAWKTEVSDMMDARYKILEIVI